MRLDAWFKQPHTPAERFRLIERLAQALNAVHDRGESLASIAPEHVEVGNDLAIDLSPAKRGRLEPGYAAPERLEGGLPSAAADIYAVGSLCWEALVGRPCGEAPKPLGDVAPDVPRELANSVMGCLERSPEWRPKDLTYLAQLAAAQQKATREPEPKAAKGKAGAKAERAAPPPRSGAAPRAAPRRASRSHLPLMVAALLLVAAAASSYLWLHREEAAPGATARAAPPVPTPVAAQPDPGGTTPPPPPVATTAAKPEPAEASPTPAIARPPSVDPTPAPTPEPTPEPTPTPQPAFVPTPEPRSASAAPAEPASLSTLSPPSVRRPGKVLLDIRGAGLRSDQRVRILPIKEAPRGITIVRQKWTSANLVSVLLELDANVATTAYAVALEDPAGALTNPLPLQITK